MICYTSKWARISALLIIYLFISDFAFAQKGITGTIYDAVTGERLSDALICEYKTTRCTRSDSLGNFFYKTFWNSITFFVSRVGYEKQWVEIIDYNQYSYQIYLEPIIYDFGLLDLNLLNLDKVLNQDTCFINSENSTQKYGKTRNNDFFPKYPGGLKCLDKLFAENFSPYIISNIIKAFDEVEIYFTINEKGDATNIRLNKEVQTEVLRLIKYVFSKMDTWYPAVQDGTNIGVNCIYKVQYDPIKDLSQEDLYQLGLDYLDQNDYDLADSLFRLYLSNEPNSYDALYNLGLAKLYQQDTLNYCALMWLACHSFADSVFCNSYYSMCGTMDTFYMDKNHMPCTKQKARYTEVIESNKFLDFKIGIVLDQRNKRGLRLVSLRQEHPLKSNIYGLYRLYDDGRTIFSFTTSPPKFPGDREAQDNYEKNSPILRSIIHNYPLKNHYARVTYLINKQGNIVDPKLLYIIKDTRDRRILMNKDNMDNYTIIEESIINYLLGLPAYIPGIFRDKYVDYQMHSIISLSD